MNKEELCELLEEIAKADISDGSDIFDHPCSVAIRAINQSFNDIGYLKRVISGSANKKSKKARMMLGLSYSPNY